MSSATRRCPTCGESFGPPLVLCPRDATVLEGELEAGPDPLVGRIFGGRFAIKERLGEGGMGAVYRAEQLSVGREVALKVLHPSFAARADAAQRFAREARLLSRLHHPGVVMLFDFGQAETGELFLAMELLKGETLAARLDRGPLSPHATARLAQSIAEALAVAHGAGIIHRDLKPDNVWIGVDDPAAPMAGRPPDSPEAGKSHGERVKVLDFGLARTVAVQTTTLTGPGTLFGTPLYMAPEVIAGKAVGPSADLYALGAIMYEMLVGKQAFERESIEAIFAAHLFDAPPPLPSDVPRPLAELVRRLLAKDPADRLGSANEVRAGLAAALETMDPRRARTDQVSGTHGTKSEVGSTTSPAPAWRDSSELPAPKKRWPLAVLGLGVLGAGGVWLAVSTSPETSAIVEPDVIAAPETASETGLAALVPDAAVTPLAPDVQPLATPGPLEAPETIVDTAPDTHATPDTDANGDTPAARAPITLRLNATPAADVTLDGKPLGRTPLTLEREPIDATGTLRFARKGFRTATLKVRLDRSDAVQLRLQPLDEEGFIVPDARP